MQLNLPNSNMHGSLRASHWWIKAIVCEQHFFKLTSEWVNLMWNWEGSAQCSCKCVSVILIEIERGQLRSVCLQFLCVCDGVWQCLCLHMCVCVPVGHLFLLSLKQWQWKMELVIRWPTFTHTHTQTQTHAHAHTHAPTQSHVSKKCRFQVIPHHTHTHRCPESGDCISCSSVCISVILEI